jgi:hypothetical protein
MMVGKPSQTEYHTGVKNGRFWKMPKAGTGTKKRKLYATSEDARSASAAGKYMAQQEKLQTGYIDKGLRGVRFYG